MKLLSFLAPGLLIIFFQNSAFAASAKEVLASADTPEGKGLAIATEGDARDFGFGDFEVTIEMTLKNTQGEESKREMRNKTFEITDEDKGDKSLIIFDNPRDVEGTAFLTFSHILEPDEQWLYLPALERVKRISSKNKSGPFMGSEFAYEDIASQEVGKYTYKYLRNEKCGDMECFVIERYPAYENSGYTKQVMWVDTAEFRPIKIDYYDRKEALLKSQQFIGYKQYLDKYWRADKFIMENMQTGKSTILLWNNYKFHAGIKESDLTKAKLKRAR